MGCARLGEVLDLPGPEEQCTGGVTLHLRNRESPRRQLVRRALCWTWRCPYCAALLRLAFGGHLGGHLLSCNRPLFASPSPAGKWAADTRRLNRGKALWLRVEPTNAVPLLLGTAPLSGGEQVSSEEAVSRLGAALRAIEGKDLEKGKRQRPVNCCQPWSLPEKEPSDWEREGLALAHSVGQVMPVLDDAGIEGTLKGDFLGFKTPEHWTQEQDDEFGRRVRRQR